jgi:hypothetical protein
MTSYDIAVPLIALGLAGGAALYVRWAHGRLMARLERQEAEDRK